MVTGNLGNLGNIIIFLCPGNLYFGEFGKFTKKNKKRTPVPHRSATQLIRVQLNSSESATKETISEGPGNWYSRESE